MPLSERERLARQFRRNLLERDAETRRQVVEAYKLTWQGVRELLEEFLAKMALAQASGRPVRVSWLYEQKRLTELLRLVDAQVLSFSTTAAAIIATAQRVGIQIASGDALALIRAAGLPAAPAFPSPALLEMIGQLQDGTPIARRIAESGEMVKTFIKKQLLVGVAAGTNPKEIGRRIARELNPQEGYGVLSSAVRLARTEVLRSHREASRETYAANGDVVRGWVWLSGRSARTCAACLAMDGKVFDTATPMGTHPQCRCVCLPYLVIDPPVSDTGEAWLRGQDLDTQARVLGRSAPDYEAARAFRQGRVSLDDFVEERHSPVWGTSRTARGYGQKAPS